MVLFISSEASGTRTSPQLEMNFGGDSKLMSSTIGTQAAQKLMTNGNDMNENVDTTTEKPLPEDTLLRYLTLIFGSLIVLLAVCWLCLLAAQAIWNLDTCVAKVSPFISSLTPNLSGLI
jgi:hypothetical protein